MFLRRILSANSIRRFGTFPPRLGLLKVPKLDVKPAASEDIVRWRSGYLSPDAASLKPLEEADALYARLHIHNWNLLVTQGDIIKLPVNMKDVKVGDKIVFNEVSQIGSRTHTLTGSPRIDPGLFTVKGVVMEKTRVKRAVDHVTRRRRRHVRNVVSNNCLTVIRVSELRLN